MTISERIFELLKQRGMTQKEFSNRTDIGQSTISDWKRKKTNPSADKILTICEVLEVSPEELLSGKEPVRVKGRKQGFYVVEKTSELGGLIREYEGMDQFQRERLLGYLHALQEFGKKE